MSEGLPGIPLDALRDYGRPVQVVSAVFYGTIVDLNVWLQKCTYQYQTLTLFKTEVVLNYRWTLLDMISLATLA
jgi:hypothetical protein